MAQPVRKLIIFDLDGTFYELRGGSYKKSPLRRAVIANATKFVAKKLRTTKAGAERALAEVQKKYGEEISIGLEKEFGINRYEYFNTVWNIPANKVIKKTASPRTGLLVLRKKYKLVLLSDAPAVWIKNVLRELKLTDIFRDAIFSGEGNRRKGFGNAFSYLARKLKTQSKNCIVVGDQEHTDILPAKALGMNTVFVHRTLKSKAADFCIKNINELARVLAG